MKRNLIIKTLCGMALLPFIGVIQAAPKSSSLGSCNAKLAITELQGLSFGNLIAASGGTVTVATDGLATSSGGVIMVGGVVAQSLFGVTSRSTCNVYSHAILLPSSITLVSAASSMVVDNFVSVISGPSLVDATGVGQISVGATLNVGVNQPSGAYSGQYILDVVFQ